MYRSTHFDEYHSGKEIIDAYEFLQPKKEVINNYLIY